MENRARIGITIPTYENQSALDAKDVMINILQGLGYNDIVCHDAKNEPATQAAQIEVMIANGCEAVIVWAIEEEALRDVLENAKASGIKIIGFVNEINSMEADYVVKPDYNEIGAIQARHICDVLQLDNCSEPHNIEIFAGAQGNTVSISLYTGAMEVLEPYITCGIVNVPSEQTDIADVSILNWDMDHAQNRMESLINAYYYNMDRPLSAVYCCTDHIAQGVINALDRAGYSSQNWPVITGMDGTAQALQNISMGIQSMTVEYMTGLAEAAAYAAHDLVCGATPSENRPVSGNGYNCNGDCMNCDYYNNGCIPQDSFYKVIDDDDIIIPTPVYLRYITIDEAPSKTTYYRGETFDRTGMVVTAHWSDETTHNVTHSCSISSGLLDLGVTTIDVMYGGKTATQNISVMDRTFESILVTKNPNKMLYVEGELFEKNGMEVTMFYSEGPSKKITNFTYGPSGKLSLDDTITIEHTEFGVTKTIDVPITVVAKNLTGIRIKTQPNKKSYIVGEYVEPDGMRVEAEYSEAAWRGISVYDTSVTPKYFEQAGNPVSVVLSYTENGNTVTATLNDIIVRPYELSYIRVTTPPNRDKYKLGDAFDKTGMIVTAYYNNGDSQVIPNYDVTANPTTLNTKGNSIGVVVSYTETFDEGDITKQATTYVTVVDKNLTGLEISSLPNKTEYKINENFDPAGMVVTAYYSDDLPEVVPNSQLSVNPTIMTSNVSSVTVSYTDVTTLSKLVPVSVGNSGTDNSKTNQTELKYNCTSGTASINLYTGRMIFELPGLSIGVNSFQIGVNHIYNSNFNEEK